MIGLWRDARALGSMRMVWISVVTLLAALLAAMPAGAAGLGPVQGGALPGPLPLFPPDNWWNVDVSGAPVDGGSAAFIAYINNGGQRRLHPDLGGEVSPGSVQTYGMPYAVVDGTQPRLTVDFVLYANQSDGVGVPFYPIPAEAITEPHWVEGGEPGNVDRRGQDRHLLIVDRDRNWLYELYNVYYNAASGRWEAGSGAFWDMNTNGRRPEGWTSADAAGLAILPGLVRYDEVYGPARARDPARVPGDGAVDEWPRVSGVTRRRLHPGRAAHGRTAAAQGGHGHLALRAGGAEDLPRHEALRAHRGRQRLRHVHRRHLRHALGQ